MKAKETAKAVVGAVAGEWGEGQQPDILEVVYWLNTIADPVERMKKATLFGDEARDQLLPELASVRRLATVQARKQLMEGKTGPDGEKLPAMTATEATRIIAEETGTSVQSVMRLISERKKYGG